MFTVKLNNAIGLAQPIITELMKDTSRPFPAKFSMRFAGIVRAAQDYIRDFQKAERDLIDKFNGIVSPEGQLALPEDPGVKEAFQKEQRRLLEEPIEFLGELLELTEDCPKLTLQEALILEPFIKEVK